MITFHDYKHNLDNSEICQVCYYPQDNCLVVQLNFFPDMSSKSKGYLIIDELSYDGERLMPIKNRFFASPMITEEQAIQVQKDVDKIRTDTTLLERIAREFQSFNS